MTTVKSQAPHTADTKHIDKYKRYAYKAGAGYRQITQPIKETEMNDKASANLQLTKPECKHLGMAIDAYVKQLEREARKHQNSGRTAVADLILKDAATILNVKNLIQAAS